MNFLNIQDTLKIISQRYFRSVFLRKLEVIRRYFQDEKQPIVQVVQK